MWLLLLVSLASLLVVPLFFLLGWFYKFRQEKVHFDQEIALAKSNHDRLCQLWDKALLQEKQDVFVKRVKVLHDKHPHQQTLAWWYHHLQGPYVEDQAQTAEKNKPKKEKHLVVAGIFILWQQLVVGVTAFVTGVWVWMWSQWAQDWSLNIQVAGVLLTALFLWAFLVTWLRQLIGWRRLIVAGIVFLFFVYVVASMEVIADSHQRQWVTLMALVSFALFSLMGIVLTGFWPTGPLVFMDKVVFIGRGVFIWGGQALQALVEGLGVSLIILACIFLSFELFGVLNYEDGSSFALGLETIQYFFLLVIPIVFSVISIYKSTDWNKPLLQQKSFLSQPSQFLRISWLSAFLMASFVMVFLLFFVPFYYERIIDSGKIVETVVPFLYLMAGLQVLCLSAARHYDGGWQKVTLWLHAFLSIEGLILSLWALWALWWRVDQYAFTYTRLVGGVATFLIAMLFLSLVIVWGRLVWWGKSWWDYYRFVGAVPLFALGVGAVFLFLMTAVVDLEKLAVGSQVRLADSRAENHLSMDRYYMQSLDIEVANFLVDRYRLSSYKMKMDIFLTLQEMMTYWERSQEEHDAIYDQMVALMENESSDEMSQFMNYVLISQSAYSKEQALTLCANQAEILLGYNYNDAYRFCNNADDGYELRYIERPEGLELEDDLNWDIDLLPGEEFEEGDLDFLNDLDL